MKTNILWYNHEVNSHTNWKFKALRNKYGWAGEAKFWALNNYIAASDYCALDIKNEMKLNQIAAELEFSPTEFVEFVKFCIDGAKLVYRDSQGFLCTEMTQDCLGDFMKKRGRQNEWNATKKGKKKVVEIKESTDLFTNSTVEKRGQKKLENDEKEAENGQISGDENDTENGLKNHQKGGVLSKPDQKNTNSKTTVENNNSTVENNNSTIKETKNHIDSSHIHTYIHTTHKKEYKEKKEILGKKVSKKASQKKSVKMQKKIIPPPPPPESEEKEVSTELVKNVATVQISPDRKITVEFHTMGKNEQAEKIVKFLSSPISDIMMNTGLYLETDEFISFIVKRFIVVFLQESPNRKPQIFFINFWNFQSDNLRQDFEKANRSVQQFDTQLEKIKSTYPADQVEKFRKYYTRMVGTKFYFQTLRGWNIETTLADWCKPKKGLNGHKPHIDIPSNQTGTVQSMKTEYGITE